MTSILSRLVLLAALTSWSCATVGPVVAPVVSTIKDCADKVTHAVGLGILDDVSSVLVCDAGNIDALPGCVVSQLTAIAAKAGWAAVDCVIAEVQQKATANSLASADPTEELRARRAAMAAHWRASVPPSP